MGLIPRSIQLKNLHPSNFCCGDINAEEKHFEKTTMRLNNNNNNSNN
jgi:hypothetical protein